MAGWPGHPAGADSGHEPTRPLRTTYGNTELIAEPITLTLQELLQTQLASVAEAAQQITARDDARKSPGPGEGTVTGRSRVGR